MKSISFLSKDVFVGKARKRGRGVFTKSNIKAGEVIEVAPVVVMSKADRKHIDQTLLHDYIFEWGDDRKQCCVALGYVSMYNHAYLSNCEYEMDFKQHIITIKTVRSIKAGEQLFINYNAVWNDESPVWFDAE